MTDAQEDISVYLIDYFKYGTYFKYGIVPLDPMIEIRFMDCPDHASVIRLLELIQDLGKARSHPETADEVELLDRIQYRMGINTGDIIIEGEVIFGDGVNVAARLEGIADPGGICIPRKIFHEVRNKIDVGYEFLGERKVKNIKRLFPFTKSCSNQRLVGLF